MATRTQLQTVLQKPYDTILFGKDVLSPVFGSLFTLSSIPIAASVQPNKSESAIIRSVSIYGAINLEDGTEITCYEIYLQPSVRIEHNRVAIQHYVRKLLTAGQIALVNFIPCSDAKGRAIGRQVWRLTLIAKDSELTEEGIKEKTTHAKRYTYLLGPSESGKTAAERLEALSIEKRITFQSLVKAFSVETLSDAFFDEYTLHYEKFCTYLQASDFRRSVFNISLSLGATAEEKDKAYKPIRDFVKKLLGRIVFLYFVQKKGWLGATDTTYKDGLRDFIKRLFKQSGGDETFYNNWLTKLFFDTLNKERTDDTFTMPDGEKRKVPFLNGGLFDKEDYDERILTFPAKLFHHADFEDVILTEKNGNHARGFFDFLDSFNFTVHEDSPDDQTVAVDPEMLGHIFENLLEDNKDKGAFYTPKEIVHYMCQESLIEYLTTHLSKEYIVYRELGNAQVELYGDDTKAGQLKLVESLGDKALNRDDVAYMVKQKDISGLTKAQVKTIDYLLDIVKICDPAIGSGAFPMGLLQEIHALKEVIAFELKQPWKPADVKEAIIQNSIYGVDIEKGAVDIARLRFWLSLVVDEETPRPLPNLDYKIVVGDSLMSKFEGEIIEIDWERKSSVGKANEYVQNIQRLLKEIAEKQETFFRTDKKEKKKKLQAEIRNLKLDLLINQLSFNKERFLTNNAVRGGFVPTASDLRYNAELKEKKKDFDRHINQLQKLKQHKEEPFEHFDWKLDFPEVLNPYLITEEKQRGFDIVIGNPPYLNFKMYSTDDKEIYRQLYPEVFDGKADIYYYFFNKSCELTKYHGITTLITSRYWIEAEYAKKLRRFLSAKTMLKEIIDFKNVTVFDGIGIKTCITSFLKTPNCLSHFHYRFHPGKKIDYIDLNEYVSNTISAENITSKDSWNLTDEASTDILKLIENETIALNEIANCKQGIVTGLDKAFITTENEFKNLPKEIVKPWLKVGDIHKYSIRLVEKRELVYTKLIDSIEDYPQLEQRLLPFKLKLSNRREAKNGKIRWFDLQWPREQELFESEKLICRFKASENIFCYDSKGFYSSADTTVVSLNSIGKKRFGTKFLLALLNSKVLSFYFKSYGKLMDYRYEYYPGPVGRLRIKNSPKQKLFSTIVDYIVFLKRGDLLITSNPLMPAYFEQIIDGMVYELYFPELIKRSNREIIEHLGELPEFADRMSDEQKMKICKMVFNRLNDRDHQVRTNLFYMSSIPEIAIIEGKHENN
ncbi:Eco57I restriction-modification methylase domain-containing protein [Flaviaesturariibacter amylovorans]|uniref:site-specific DNA-methyltransferase (adenine-specific) n=1 Tax=Flaviaesturariibacter amylovorans TaxID=1084520 RepID=A0ABP8HHS4_9BACT